MTAGRLPLWRRLRNAWRHSRRKLRCIIDLRDDGFVFTAWGRKTDMRWADVCRIDAGIRDCFTFDVCYVALFDAYGGVEIEELDEGFSQFEYALFDHWPQIRTRWEELLKSQSSEVQRETLWQR
jgi:hypothetical protein